MVFGDTIAGELGCTDSLNPLADRSDLQITAKGIKRVLLCVSVILKHFDDLLPCLPDPMLVDRPQVLFILFSVVLLRLFELIFVFQLVLVLLLVRRFDGKAGNFEFVLFPF